ncbi:hypothetical protein [Paraburkholderia kururiensis]|uniref:hypothetical protein n=1 Tax=Paraburkholderia kururiensis TaxID=984307 RepID=UPI000F87524E|nr:hypothetical protein [Paraburkholderia kururiensis]
MNYTVRVELHGVKHDSEKYAELHDEMSKQGFRRNLSINGVSYRLPTAEYSRVSSDTKEQILGKAKTAARAVMGSDSKYSVLVTGDKNPRAHHNLEKV